MNTFTKMAFVAGATALMPTLASASTMSFLGETLTVSGECETTECDPTFVNTVTVDGTPEINAGDGSDIGGYLISGESIDFGVTSITFNTSDSVLIILEITGYSGIVTSLTNLFPENTATPQLEDYIELTNNSVFTDGVSADGKTISATFDMFDSDGTDAISLGVVFEKQQMMPAVPLPAGGLLLLTGMAGLGALRKYRLKS